MTKDRITMLSLSLKVSNLQLYCICVFSKKLKNLCQKDMTIRNGNNIEIALRVNCSVIVRTLRKHTKFILINIISCFVLDVDVMHLHSRFHIYDSANFLLCFGCAICKSFLKDHFIKDFEKLSQGVKNLSTVKKWPINLASSWSSS